MKSKTLIIILVVLGAALAINYYIENKTGDRTLLGDLVAADTTELTAISVFPKVNNKEEVRFVKDGDTWALELEGKKVSADKNAIQSILREIQNLKPARLASTSEEKWEEYEVTDSLGIQAKMEVDGKVVADLIFGKFDFNQQTRAASSYVRINGEDEVYAVNGYLSMTFDREAEGFRDRTLINADQSQWTRISYSYPGDSSFVLTKGEDGYWLADGQAVDSISCANYLSSMSRLGGNVFADDFDASTSTPSHSITIEGENIEPITLDAYVADPAYGYVINSSQNKGIYMSGNNDVFNRSFVNKAKFDIVPPMVLE